MRTLHGKDDMGHEILIDQQTDCAITRLAFLHEKTILSVRFCLTSPACAELCVVLRTHDSRRMMQDP